MVDYDKFEALNVQVLAIGASNPFSQKTFAASLKLPYPLLSDYPDLEVIRKYGVLKYIGEAKRPVARGSYFLIDKQGVVRGKWMPKTSFKITEQSLEDLESEHVPDDVRVRLEGIKDQEFSGEQKFLAILKDTLGEERTVQYNSLILKHARPKEVNVFPSDPFIELARQLEGKS